MSPPIDRADSGMWGLVQTVLGQAAIYHEGEFSDRDAATLSRGEATGYLRPLTRATLVETMDVVVECLCGCGRSLARLAASAQRLPARSRVSIPKHLLANFIENVLPLLSQPVIILSADPASDASTGHPEHLPILESPMVS